MKKRVLMASIIFFILIIVIILGVKINNESDGLNEKQIREILLQNSYESAIIREFSSMEVLSGEQIDIKLYLYALEEETYFALEEHIPEGWTVINNNEGGTTDPNKLAWYEFNEGPLSNSTIVYTLQAPSTPGTYNFEGIYQFEGDSSHSEILGDTTVIVA